MHVFQPVNPEDIENSAYRFVGEKIIISSIKDGKVNAVAAGWGGVGYVWNKRVTFIFVRKSRYTAECIDESGEYSISFMDQDQYRGALKYLSMVSGRDEDKIAGSRLTVNYDDGIPFIDEAREVITCKVIYKQGLDQDCFVDKNIIDELYKDGDYHFVYAGEVKKILLR